MTLHMRACVWLLWAVASVGVMLFGWPLLFAFRFQMFRAITFPKRTL